MTKFFSIRQRGFFDADLHGDKLPADAVEISDELYFSLINGQSEGMIIDWSSDAPTLCALPSEFDAAFAARKRRDAMLAASDWTQIPDATVDAKAWRKYRQALRDISSQPDFPDRIEWPVSP